MTSQTTTSETTETRIARSADLGSIAVMSWAREAPEGTVPFLLACPLGDGEKGPGAGSAAVAQMLDSLDLPRDGQLVDGTSRPSMPVTLLVVPGGSAVLTMPYVNAQITPSEAWQDAVAERGYACLIFTTRPWTGEDTDDPEAIAAFANAEETLQSAAKVVLPVRSLRGH
ncbi:DUF5949 family protein [Streptomyces griseosporeus]|uniref:DUF5949 family protein n=1 Tax=Streptomyces griseosporeus TaxID=1910 RepID=UPI0037001DB2